ncbi:glycosyltransferase family 2 protein [Ferruginibacter paludis]|uniref:glycosyltransferase family 2 protein n=1 Tax=Ferruginibacter paludis TaxID=1310417 RepID=UPI0025B49565|nr:glycosyltransferase family 2 protein [Ferruginibacter paludis]MDN3654406.1 glycosyltransferase family 2 protein [Ferruginibacter paludis]
MSVYSLTLLQDLEIINTYEGSVHYRNEGIDPHFHVNLPKSLKKGWYEIIIPIKCLKGAIREPKIYFNLGDGYNENFTIPIPEIKEDKIIAVVAFPGEVKSIRFDPTTTPSEFLIQDIKISKLSQLRAARKLFLMLKSKNKHNTMPFLFTTLKRNGISGVRKEFREASYLHVYQHGNADNQSYEEWLASQIDDSRLAGKKMKDTTAAFSYSPLISIVITTYNTPIGWLDECISSVLNQTYRNWELCISDDASTSWAVRESLRKYAEKDSRINVTFRKTNGYISTSTNTALELVKGEWVAFLDHDDTLTENALFEMVKYLQNSNDLDVIYSDQDKINVDGSYYQPFFKPDWSPVFFCGVMYVGHLLFVRYSIGKKAGWFDSKFDKVQDYEFVLRVSEITDKIGHIPKVLYHWRESIGSTALTGDAKGKIEMLQELAVNWHFKRLGIPGYARQNRFAHRLSLLPFERQHYPKVSIIIPTKNCAPLLKNCVESILEKTAYPNYEIVIIDTGSNESDAIHLLNKFKTNEKINVLDYKEKFNFSKVNNFGVGHASGDYYVFLNNDTEVIVEEWLNNLVFFADIKQVGAVGSLLLFPNNAVQHAGIVLGFRETADHVMRNFPSDSDGYFGSLSCTREVSAVTAACIMVRKDIFRQVNGFEGSYESVYQDVDLCLKIRNKGYTIICTPASVLFHHESISRGNDYDFMDRMLLKDQWESVLRSDPYYNQNFKLNIYGQGQTGYEPKYKVV